MANANTKSVQSKAAPVGNDDMPDFSKWTKRQIGFAPYFQPEAGQSWFGKIVARDERDPAFMRYLVVAGRAMTCYRGPADDAEKVEIGKGEQFTISIHRGVEDEFDLYLESGLQPYCLCTATKKGKTKTGNDFWHYQVQVSPEDDVKLLSYVRDREARRLGGSSGRPALES